MVPCEGCVALAVCKYKTYNRMMLDCSLIQKYINDVPLGGQHKRLEELVDIMNPGLWTIQNKLLKRQELY